MKSINLNDVYNAVSRRTDTEGTKINVAETKRVLACFFDELQELTPQEFSEVLAKGTRQARDRRK
ncbi:MAG: hypothetical protein AAGG48_14595 [Planctomycetota bacterium]